MSGVVARSDLAHSVVALIGGFAGTFSLFMPWVLGGGGTQASIIGTVVANYVVTLNFLYLLFFLPLLGLISISLIKEGGLVVARAVYTVTAALAIIPYIHFIVMIPDLKRVLGLREVIAGPGSFVALFSGVVLMIALFVSFLVRTPRVVRVGRPYLKPPLKVKPAKIA